MEIVIDEQIDNVINEQIDKVKDKWLDKMIYQRRYRQIENKVKNYQKVKNSLIDNILYMQKEINR